MKFIIILPCFLVFAQSANILGLFPHSAASHLAMFRRVIEELALRGHQVDIYTHLPSDKKQKNINDIDLKEISPPFANSRSIKELRELSHDMCQHLIFEFAGLDLCKDFFNTTMFKQLRDTEKKYDLLMVELFGADCFFGFGHHFKIPVVALTSSVDLPWGGYRMGNPDNPSYIRHYFSSVSPTSGIIQRLINTLTLIDKKIRQRYYVPELNEISREFFGNSLPDLDELVSNTNLLLVNSHFSINQAIPTNPNFIEIGGVHIKEPKPIDKNIKDIINNEKFIYFSLGSIAGSETFSPNVLQMIFDVFKELKIKVLWKAAKDKFPTNLTIPKNIHFLSWAPQLSLLCDPNIVLFITHSGLMSTQEGVYCGVPMLSFPLFADQYMNSENVEQKGFGKKVSFETISKDELYAVINDLIYSPKYKNSAMLYSKKFKDRPLKPIDEALFWIEYVLRYGDIPEFKSEARKLTWYQYYMLDIFLILLGAAFIVFLLLFYVIKFIVGVVLSHPLKLKNE